MTPGRPEPAPPHIQLAGLKLWIHGYQYRDAGDADDANWLDATAFCADNGASVLVRGAFLRTTEILGWQRAVERLSATLSGEALLDCMEPEIAVRLTAGPRGSVEMAVQITPDPLTQEHYFRFAIDQSHLATLASECAQLLAEFPVRGQ